jgi:hypothetical protein
MFGINRPRPAYRLDHQPAEQPDTLTTAGRLARREGQIITVDHLTAVALTEGVDTDLAIDVRKALGLPMPGREGGAR